MTDTDVQLLLVDLALIIVLARLLGAVARRMGQPPVLGEIVAGILLGPTIWGTKITATLFPPTLIPPLTALADLGLVFFMFVVGYEVDLGLVRGRGRGAASARGGSPRRCWPPCSPCCCCPATRPTGWASSSSSAPLFSALSCRGTSQRSARRSLSGLSRLACLSCSLCSSSSPGSTSTCAGSGYQAWSTWF